MTTSTPTPIHHGLEPDIAQRLLEQGLFEMKRVIAGQEMMLERVLVALLANGHLLIEGVPGLAKTLTVKTLADVLGGTFQRVQFTPDLVPSDLVGTRVYRPDTGRFDTETGPVFCNFLLADEINRAPAKVQSALLATQNPIESEGTYPLPEAQVDRFMMKVLVDYPTYPQELTVVDRSLGDAPQLEQVLDLDQLRALQRAARDVYVDPQVADYAVSLAVATRHPEKYGLPALKQYIAYGASPRGSIYLVHTARALAFIRGRRYVLPQDVRDLALDVLRHRIVLSYQALAEEVTSDQILAKVLAAIVPPAIELARERSA